MSRFFSEKHASLEPYVPGEQPKERKYVKLNTNESPFPPAPLAVAYAKSVIGTLELYSDPELRDLCDVASNYFRVEKDEIIFTNGSDEILDFAFSAFCDEKHPAVFPDITYGFYPVFAEKYGIPYETIPLERDLSVDVEKYIGVGKTVFLANPNAPTGIALPLEDIERIVVSNPDNVIVIDEAYVDFGARSAVKLIKKYDNLLVTQTFSKSRSLAGARLGMGFACKELISDLNTLRYSTNPYNVNRVTENAGIGALLDDAYMKENCKKIIENREYTVSELKKLGFEATDSKANFIFVKRPGLGGKDLYLALKESGVLVRYFDKDRLRDYVRVTIGSKKDMDVFLANVKTITDRRK